MLETSSKLLYLSAASSSDLSCLICCCAFGLEENQPISTNCGHTICSKCFDNVTNCPFCNQRFDKIRHKHQKSIFITDLIANSAKINICKEHSEICQGFCLQEKRFICFDCAMKNHKGHKIFSIKEIGEKAENARIVLQNTRKKKESKQLELNDSLDAENKRQKRQLDEIIDQEISHLSLLKKKLYKEVDIRIMSEKDNYEHHFLSENLSKHCNSLEKLLGDWNKNQEATLAAQILEAPSEEIQGVQNFENQVEIFKAEVTKKHAQNMNDMLKSLNSISHSSVKFKKLFLPNKKISTQNFPQAELDYLIGVFNEYNLIVSPKNNSVLEIKAGPMTLFIPKFDPIYFTCSLSKISLSCLGTLPETSFQTICQILQSIQALKDVTLHLVGLDLTVLFSLISNLKSLEKFSVQMNLTQTCKSAVTQFMVELIKLKNFFSLDLQHKEPETMISFQLVPSTIMKKPFETLHEISLDLGLIPEIVRQTLIQLIESQEASKSLKILRFALGKTDCNPQLLDDVCETLELQNDLEELIFTCEDLNDLTNSDLLIFLSAATSKKKLGIFINKVSISHGSLTTKFLPKAHPVLENLEELVLKIKYGVGRVYSERFECLIDFLATSKALRKLFLQFDGGYSYYGHAEKLFSQIVKLGSLASLELEFVDFRGLNSDDERDLETILNKLPGSVAKKCMFKKSNNWVSYRDNYEPYEYSEEDILSDRDNYEDEVEEDDDYWRQEE